LDYPQATDGEIFSLTSVRGIAAFWVVLFHFWTVLVGVLPEGSALSPLVLAGGFAVPLFFILSGYVLGLRYLIKLSSPTTKGVLRFWWLRLGRVYPVHVCTLLVSLCLVARHGWPTDEGHSVGRFLANCFLIHAWDYSFRLSWNYPSWSISSEWFAYLIFPLLAVALSRIGRTSASVLLVLACGLSACVYAFEQHLAFKGLVVVLPTFVGGVLLAIRFPPTRTSDRPHRWAEVCLLAILVLPFIAGPASVQSALYLVLFFMLVGALGTNGNRALVFWRFWPLVFLGEISYSLYMTHAITITLMTRFFPFEALQGTPVVIRMGVLLGCVIVILGVATAAYYAVERPMRSLSRLQGASSNGLKPSNAAMQLTGPAVLGPTRSSSPGRPGEIASC
jgi:peptidoglycan/LPS O-acetylase OafA/YrhL